MAEEEGPDVAELVDLANIGPQLQEAVADSFEGCEGIDCDAVVVDGTAASLAMSIADYLVLGCHLDHVEGGAAAEIEYGHPGMVGLGRHLEGLDGAERLFIEGHDPF